MRGSDLPHFSQLERWGLKAPALTLKTHNPRLIRGLSRPGKPKGYRAIKLFHQLLTEHRVRLNQAHQLQFGAGGFYAF